MSGDRYVLLGLARPRSDWFRRVAQWSTAAMIPAEFLKCVSAEEVRARLASGRPCSALLVEGTLPAVDRDLLDAARAAGCVVFVVDDGRAGRDWVTMGAAAVLDPHVDRAELVDALARNAELVARPTAALVDAPDSEPVALGRVAVVCGPGGTGTSTVAAALAQGLGTTRGATAVLLADLARNAEQAMLHDVRDVVPGIQELVEVHRARRPSDDELLGLTFHVVERRYHLLLGLRHARYWSALRPRAFDAAFRSLRCLFDVTVCDITADFEGEQEGGSADVGERNHAARATVASADVVFVVGRPGAKGLHALVRVLADLGAAGVPAGRVVPVFNVAPRHPRQRAELVDALADLARPAMGGGVTVSPVFLPRRDVEPALRDAVSLPSPLPSLLRAAYEATFDRIGPAQPAEPPEPELVRPGTIGGFLEEER